MSTETRIDNTKEEDEDDKEQVFSENALLQSSDILYNTQQIRANNNNDINISSSNRNNSSSSSSSSSNNNMHTNQGTQGEDVDSDDDEENDDNNDNEEDLVKRLLKRRKFKLVPLNATLGSVKVKEMIWKEKGIRKTQFIPPVVLPELIKKKFRDGIKNSRTVPLLEPEICADFDISLLPRSILERNQNKPRL